MEGEPIQAVNAGLKALEADLQANPRALKTAWLSVITFSSEAQQVIPLTKAKDFTAPTLATEYETRLDYGLQTLLDCIDREGPVSPERLLEATGLDQVALQREIAALRHMELVRGAPRPGGKRVILRFDAVDPAS
jgi:hypothetical protein